MTKKNPAGLRIDPENFRTADIIMSVVFVVVTIISLYFAIGDGVRDFWLLVVVGIIGAVLTARRVITKSPDQ